MSIKRGEHAVVEVEVLAVVGSEEAVLLNLSFVGEEVVLLTVYPRKLVGVRRAYLVGAESRAVARIGVTELVGKNEILPGYVVCKIGTCEGGGTLTLAGQALTLNVVLDALNKGVRTGNYDVTSVGIIVVRSLISYRRYRTAGFAARNRYRLIVGAFRDYGA